MNQETKERVLRNYAKADVRVHGEVVMEKGKIIDSKWWKGKLKKIESYRQNKFNE